MVKYFVMEEYLEKLEYRMKLKGFSLKTVKSYKYNIKQFLKFINKNPEKVSKEDIESYFTNLIDNGYMSASIRLNYASLKFFFALWVFCFFSGGDRLALFSISFKSFLRSFSSSSIEVLFAYLMKFFASNRPSASFSSFRLSFLDIPWLSIVMFFMQRYL